MKNENLTAQQARTIEALLTEPTQEKAAVKAKVSRATITRWMSGPTFKQAYSEARSQLIETVMTALHSASVTAVTTLTDVMDDKEAQPSARVSAAKTVLDNLLRSREQIEIEERLKNLEKQLSGKGQEKSDWTN
jgi:hypothetical protein